MLLLHAQLTTGTMEDKTKPSSILQELCKKLKLQLDELGVVKPEYPPPEDIGHRQDLFKELQDQLNELSR